MKITLHNTLRFENHMNLNMNLVAFYICIRGYHQDHELHNQLQSSSVDFDLEIGRSSGHSLRIRM